MGLKSGDAKILRNAGARVTEDVLRTLVLATYLLGVKKILVMPHTNCRMASAEEADTHEHIQKEFGVDTRSLEFRTVKDQEKALALDVSRIRAYPFLNKDVVVGGAIYDVTKWSDATFIEDQDQWWHGGITRSVKLYATNKVFIERFKTVSGLEKDVTTGTLSHQIRQQDENPWSYQLQHR